MRFSPQIHRTEFKISSRGQQLMCSCCFLLTVFATQVVKEVLLWTKPPPPNSASWGSSCSALVLYLFNDYLSGQSIVSGCGFIFRTRLQNTVCAACLPSFGLYFPFNLCIIIWRLSWRLHKRKIGRAAYLSV